LSSKTQYQWELHRGRRRIDCVAQWVDSGVTSLSTEQNTLSSNPDSALDFLSSIELFNGMYGLVPASLGGKDFKQWVPSQKFSGSLKNLEPKN